VKTLNYIFGIVRSILLNLIVILIRKMLGVLLMFSWCSLNCDITFKITNRLKVNNDNFKFNDDFKSHITNGRIPGEYYENS
jgi:hypothetical protein